MVEAGAVRIAASLLLLSIIFLITLVSWSAPVFRDAEAILYDLRASLMMETIDQDDRIVILTYDEKTVFKSKQYSPLDWNILTRTLDDLQNMKPRAVALDFIYDQSTDADEQLLQAITELEIPVKIALISAAGTSESAWHDPEVSQKAARIERQFHDRATTGNAESVDVSLQLDVGRVVRAWPAANPLGYRPLSHALADPPQEYDRAGYSITYRRPVYAQDNSVFLKISLDEFQNEFSKQQLKSIIAGKYVLIGLDVPGSDVFRTPISIITRGRMMAGVNVHANMLAQILDDNWLVLIPAWLVALLSLFIIAIASLTAFSEMPNSRLVPSLFIQLLLLIALPFLFQWMNYDTLNIPAFGWVACWILSYMVANSLAKSIGLDKRRFAQGALGKYLPDEVAKQILADPEKLKLKGEKREIFALFSDLQGFTKLSHAIPPETVAVLLNDYLQRLSEVVLEHGGTIDKFVGDAVVAFWGAPIARPGDAERAVDCAIAMWDCGEKFRKEAPGDVPPIGITRIGLHFGEAIVGNFGGDDRIQYTALGDAMNTAARLESANKQTGTGILISGDVLGQLQESRPFRQLGRVSLSGRSTPIAILQPVDEADREIAEQSNRIYAEFDSGKAGALDRLLALKDSRPGDLAIAKFCDRLKSIDPGGSYVFESK
ncbi:CHASE2 domain-containing protein [Parasphingorhabdus sp.]|uniref:CHASE2 domain-containing protein n=1 Tax=Parasphingorhabdus sp. TaxID=2709688 RepID=UPI003C7318E8